MKTSQKYKHNTALLIPVYNESKVIKSVVNNALKAFDTVICVNDGSSDTSALEISKTNAYLI